MPRDARRHGPLDHRLAIGLEGRVLEVAMRVDHAGQALRRAAAAQGRPGHLVGQLDAREERLRVRRSAAALGPPPQASSVVEPGPAAPRSS